MIRDGGNVLFGKEIIVPEATLKIGYDSIKSKQSSPWKTDHYIHHSDNNNYCSKQACMFFYLFIINITSLQHVVDIGTLWKII